MYTRLNGVLGWYNVHTCEWCVRLILSGLSINASRYKVATVTSHFLSLVGAWLPSNACPCKLPLSLSSQELMTLTRTYLSSKTFKFGLSSLQVNNLSSLLLQAFLSVLPSTVVECFSFPSHVSVVTHSGRPLVDSTLVHGVAIAISDQELVGQLERGFIKRTDEGGILTAVFNVSLAGDWGEGKSMHSEHYYSYYTKVYSPGPRSKRQNIIIFWLANPTIFLKR